MRGMSSSLPRTRLRRRRCSFDTIKTLIRFWPNCRWRLKYLGRDHRVDVDSLSLYLLHLAAKIVVTWHLHCHWKYNCMVLIFWIQLLCFFNYQQIYFLGHWPQYKPVGWEWGFKTNFAVIQNQSNVKLALVWYFPIRSKWVFSACPNVVSCLVI